MQFPFIGLAFTVSFICTKTECSENEHFCGSARQSHFKQKKFPVDFERRGVNTRACQKSSLFRTLCVVETPVNGVGTTLHKSVVLTGRTDCIDIEPRS
jgi:hypothetical protein